MEQQGGESRRITIHHPEDFEGMRRAGRLAAETLDMITPHVKPASRPSRSTR
jgi:methionyl aminopeptidase